MTVTEDQQWEHPMGLPLYAQSPASAREAINEMLDAGLLDDVMDRVDAGGLRLTGEGGFLPEMIKAVLERGLQVEQTQHLGTVVVGGPGDATLPPRAGVPGFPRFRV